MSKTNSNNIEFDKNDDTSSNKSNIATIDDKLSRKRPLEHRSRIMTAYFEGSIWKKCELCFKCEKCICNETWGKESTFGPLSAPIKNIFYSEFLKRNNKIDLSMKRNSKIKLEISHDDKQGVLFNVLENEVALKEQDFGVSSLDTFKNFKPNTIDIKKHALVNQKPTCKYLGFDTFKKNNNSIGEELLKIIKNQFSPEKIYNTPIANSISSKFSSSMTHEEMINSIHEFIEEENNIKKDYIVNKINIDFTIENYTFFRAIGARSETINAIYDMIDQKKQLIYSIKSKLEECESNRLASSEAYKSISTIFINNKKYANQIKKSLWSNEKYPDFEKCGIKISNDNIDENDNACDETEANTGSKINENRQNEVYDDLLKSSVISILLSLVFIEKITKQTIDLLLWMKNRIKLYENYKFDKIDTFDNIVKREFDLFLPKSFDSSIFLLMAELGKTNINSLMLDLNPCYLKLFNEKGGFSINFIRVAITKKDWDRKLECKRQIITSDGNFLDFRTKGIKNEVYEDIFTKPDSSEEAINKIADWAKKTKSIRKLNSLVLSDVVNSEHRAKLIEKLNGIDEAKSINYITVSWNNISFNLGFVNTITITQLCCQNHNNLFALLLPYNRIEQSEGYPLKREVLEKMKSNSFKDEFKTILKCTVNLNENDSRHLSAIIKYVEWTNSMGLPSDKLHKKQPQDDKYLAGYWLLYPREAKSRNKTNNFNNQIKIYSFNGNVV